MTSGFVILHGWQNHRPAGHWQRWLAESLAARGHVVRYPQLPDPDEPRLADWLAAIEKNLLELPTDRLTVICHSLACAAWRHLAATGPAPVQRLVFVAPPGLAFLAGKPLLSTFGDMPAAGHTTATEARPRLVCSDNDPYCPPGDYAEYAGHFEIDTIAGEGHFDMTAGYGEWPSILDWAEHPEISIRARGSGGR